MNTTLLRIALTFSLLANAGVIGAVVYRALVPSAPPAAGTHLPRYLQLDAQQLARWQASEQAFLAQLESAAGEIRARRDRLIRAIFAEAPDTASIEAERAAIAQLQDRQQKAVIAQLLAERDLLRPQQRERLVSLLLAQPAAPSGLEQLHRD